METAVTPSADPVVKSDIKLDPAVAAMLRDLVRKEGRSLVQYVVESYPWTTEKDAKRLPPLFEVAQEERDGAAAVVRLLLKHRVTPPYLGAYPMSYTTINYQSLGFLVPYLVDFEKRRIAELDAEAAALTDGEVKHALRTLVEMKRRHLGVLSGL